MIQIIRSEWEISKTYIFDVALRDGIINLDEQDFENMARKSKPAVAVKIDENLDVSELTEKAIRKAKENVKGKLVGIITVVSFKKGNDLMMDEMGGINACFSCLADEGVDILWGLQQDDSITGSRCVTVFAFESEQ